ncbi:hypothetical protein ACWGHM_07595 [Streptomyces sp. NPDC054904]|uniref:hypothetical protein n=1 Tax=Streptomyces sp. NPDC090054 TaxID=3365933 RepID=UPI00383089C3
MNTDLHTDPVAAGGLPAALMRRAAELGADVTVLPGDRGPLASAGIASPDPARNPLSVRARSGSPRFDVRGWSRGVELVSGSTDDLTDVVRAGVAWVGARGSGTCGRNCRSCPTTRRPRRTSAVRRRWSSCSGASPGSRRPRPRNSLGSANSWKRPARNPG